MKTPNPPRKQHFVPQFYLRNFCSDDHGLTISTYDHQKDKFYIDVPVKTQAYEDYAYGEDGEIEKELSAMEAKFAKLISDPIHKILPPLKEDDFHLLLLFTLTQYGRTVKAGADILDTLNISFDAIRPYLQDQYPIPDDVSISHQNPAALALVNAIENRYLMGHLEVKSIVNLTPIEFILSDNPIVPYNIWMEKQGPYLGATALASKGLLLFMPIAPRLMYCFYDPYIYEFGQPNRGTVRVESDNDIHQLNTLQYLNSDKQLYYSGRTMSSEYLRDLAAQNKHLRIDNRSLSQVTKTGFESREEALTLINTSEDPRIGLDLPFIQFTPAGRQQKLIGAFPEARHPEFLEELARRRANKSHEN